MNDYGRRKREREATRREARRLAALEPLPPRAPIKRPVRDRSGQSSAPAARRSDPGAHPAA